MKRPTIADIARRAGVSKGAVSYALNGQPGRLRGDPAAHPGHRRRRSGSTPAAPPGRCPAPARRRGRPGPVPAGPDTRHRAVLHGADQRRRGRTVRPVVRADPAGGGRPRRRDRGLPALVGRAAGGRRARLRPARRRHPRSPALERAATAGGGDRRARRHRGAGPASGPTTPPRWPRRWSTWSRSGHRRIARVGGLPDLLHTEIRTEAFAEVCAAARPDRRGHGAGPTTPARRVRRATRRLLSSARPARPRSSTTTT